MNICIIISSLDFGGAEKQAVVDANLLSDEHKVYFITFNGGPQKSLLNNGVKYIELKKTNYLKTAFLLRDIVKKENIEVIHSSLFSAMIISALSSLFSKVKVIWHFHSHEYELTFFAKLSFIITSRISEVQKIVFVSEELKKYLSKRLLFAEKKLKVVYNSGNVKEVSNKKNKDKIIIGYIGRLVELKRVHYLIQTADYLINSKITNFEIWIVGDGEEMQNIKNEVNSRELSAYIRFFGFQRDTEKFYKYFDIFVLPSREECLSISLIDAGLAGIPSVAFDVGGNNEIIETGKTGFIVSDIEAMKNKILILLNDEKLRNNMGKTANERCVKLFSKENRLIKLRELNVE